MLAIRNIKNLVLKYNILLHITNNPYRQPDTTKLALFNLMSYHLIIFKIDTIIILERAIIRLSLKLIQSLYQNIA